MAVPPMRHHVEAPDFAPCRGGSHWSYRGVFWKYARDFARFRRRCNPMTGRRRQKRSRKMRHIWKICRPGPGGSVAGAALSFAQESPPPSRRPSARPPRPRPSPPPSRRPRSRSSRRPRTPGPSPRARSSSPTFIIKNNGGSDLDHLRRAPRMRLHGRLLRQGHQAGRRGQGRHVSVDTKSFSGPISKSVLLVSNDPDRPQMNLFVKAIVKPFVDVAAARLRALLGRQGRPGLAGRHPHLRGEGLQADRRRDRAALRQGGDLAGRRQGQDRRASGRPVQAARLRHGRRARGAPQRADPRRRPA